MSINRGWIKKLWAIYTIEWYSAIEGMKLWHTLQSVWTGKHYVSERSQTQKPHSVWFYLYEMSWIDNYRDKRRTSGCQDLGEVVGSGEWLLDKAFPCPTSPNCIKSRSNDGKSLGDSQFGVFCPWKHGIWFPDTCQSVLNKWEAKTLNWPSSAFPQPVVCLCVHCGIIHFCLSLSEPFCRQQLQNSSNSIRSCQSCVRSKNMLV